MNKVTIANIMSKEILFVAPDESLISACQRMNEINVGSAIVGSQRNVRGIITERDILRAVKPGNKNFLEMKVSDLMTTKVKSIDPGETLEVAEDMMNQGWFRHLPVIKDGEVVGVISSKDIFKAFHHQEVIKRKQLEAVKNMIVTYAHELNNPLAIVRGCADKLNLKFDAKMLEMLNRGVDRMIDVLKKISEIEKLEEVEYSGRTKMYDLKKS